jgi:hypothetical protein
MRSLPVPAFAAERKALGAISDDALAMAIQEKGPRVWLRFGPVLTLLPPVRLR